jgi:tetrahydromethanopterin S-methyltransferase subunit C
MILAAILFWRSDVWEREMMLRIHGTFGASPYFDFLVAINFPVALVRAFTYRYLSEVLDCTVFIGMISLLWYWVGLNIEHWQKNRTVFTFSQVPARLILDLLLIAAGLFCGLLGSAEAGHIYPERWSKIILGFALTWCFALVFFFGWDFIRCIRNKNQNIKVAQR